MRKPITAGMRALVLNIMLIKFHSWERGRQAGDKWAAVTSVRDARSASILHMINADTILRCGFKVPMQGSDVNWAHVALVKRRVKRLRAILKSVCWINCNLYMLFLRVWSYLSVKNIDQSGKTCETGRNLMQKKQKNSWCIATCWNIWNSTVSKVLDCKSLCCAWGLIPNTPTESRLILYLVFKKSNCLQIQWQPQPVILNGNLKPI